MAGLPGLEASCTIAGRSEETTENMYENGLELSPPSPLSMSEMARPYSPIGVYPPPVNSPSRFPPPPNSGLSQTYPLNMTAFEGPSWYQNSSHPSPERVAPYHWPKSGVGSVSAPKYISHWPSPSGNNSVDYTKFPSTATTEPSYPTIANTNPYPVSDSRSNNTPVPRFSSSVVDQSTVSPNTAVPSSSCASTPPLFSSASTQTARPHLSNRFSFNPHASAFYPGMYSQTPYDSSEDFSLYCEPSFISQLAPTDFLFSHEGVDGFHDASSRRPVHSSPETAPRLISSSARSLFPGPAASSNPSVAPPLSSRADYCGLTSSSDGSGTREFSCDFPPVSSLSFKLPASGASILSPYDTATATGPPRAEVESAEIVGYEIMEQAVNNEAVTGTLLYRQTISPEEWRWNVYETRHEPPIAEGLVDFADGVSVDSLSSKYNYFPGVERIRPSCMNGNSNSFFALGIPERPRFQNQGGPSLKLAASALAEMLATTSTGRSMVAHGLPSVPHNTSSVHADMDLPAVDDPLEAIHLPWLEEKALDDCCSSSGSVAVVKEANDTAQPEGSFLYEFSHHHQSIGNQNNRGVGLANFDTSSQSQNSTAAWHPANVFFNTLLEDGTTHGRREFNNNNASGSILPMASAPSSTACNLENISCDNPIPLFTQSVGESPYTDSGITRRLTQSVDAVSSGEDDSVSGGGLRANVTAVDSSITTGRCYDDLNRHVERQVPPIRLSQNFGSPGGCSSLTAVSPSLPEPNLADPPAISTADEVAAKLLASFSLMGPQTVDTMGGTVPTQRTVLQSISTSIANLTKVLLATHSSSFPELDIAPVQDSLQDSILGLSQCLLLEQARVDRGKERVASNSVGQSGLNDFTGYEQFAADVTMENSEAKWPGEAHAEGNENHMKVAVGVHVKGQSSVGGRREESRSPSSATGSEISGMTESDKEAPLETEKTPVWRENADAVSRHFQAPVEAKAGPGNFVTVSDQTNTCQLEDGEIIGVVDFLRKRDLINLPALEKLLAAEEREKELIALIQDLQEQLQFQQEESRGTAYLCEAIMQESDLRSSKLRGKSISVPRKSSGESAGTTDGVADHLQCDSGQGEPSGYNAERDDVNKSVLKGETEQIPCSNTEVADVELRCFEVDNPKLDGMEARLAVLLRRPGRDTGEEVLNETESSSPEYPLASNSNLVKAAPNESPSPGLYDAHMIKEGAPSGLASHMLKQSEILFNIDAAWKKGYDFVGPQSESADSRKFENDHTASQECGGSLSFEERAEIIRSRYSSSGNDTGKCNNGMMYAGGSDYESLLGAYDISGLSHSQDSWLDNILGRLEVTLEDLVHSDDGHRQQGVARHASGSFDTQGPQSTVQQHLVVSDVSNSQDTWLDNIIGRSDVALQDLVHSHDNHCQQELYPHTSLSPETKEAYDLPHLAEALGSDKEAVKSVTPSQDSEEESGWEHVRLPRQMAK